MQEEREFQQQQQHPRSFRNNDEIPIPQTFDFSTRAAAPEMGEAKQKAKTGLSGLASKISHGATGLKEAIFGKNEKSEA